MARVWDSGSQSEFVRERRICDAPPFFFSIISMMDYLNPVLYYYSSVLLYCSIVLIYKIYSILVSYIHNATTRFNNDTRFSYTKEGERSVQIIVS